MLPAWPQHPARRTAVAGECRRPASAFYTGACSEPGLFAKQLPDVRLCPPRLKSSRQPVCGRAKYSSEMFSKFCGQFHRRIFQFLLPPLIPPPDFYFWLGQQMSNQPCHADGMKIKRTCRLPLFALNFQTTTIARFGPARLVKHCDGRHELIGGTAEHHAAAREWFAPAA